MQTKFLFKIILFSLYSTLPLSAHHYSILVLPSGGATAIISATLLEYLELKTGRPTRDLFDEIWSSSAGSIIAALLTTPSKLYTAHNIVAFFEHNFRSYQAAYCIRTTIKTFYEQQLFKKRLFLFAF